VLVDDNGKLGTVAVNEIGIKTKQPQAIPQGVQPKAIGPDPKQAMLNRRVEELQATVARQQKQIDALAAGLQKVSAQLEASKPAPKVVASK
jgi:SlyX protein